MSTYRTLAGLALAAALSSPAAAGTLQRVASFGSNPGGLEMYEYVPASPAPDAPLVVFMHGCSQQYTQAAATGWTQLADQYGFYLVFPNQTSANNPITCFNWAGEYGDPANLVRGQGENQSIKQMVDQMKTAHDIDPGKVFVAGFSAGGAFVPVMLATWPDVFAAGAVNAGIPYRCATSVNGAYNCQALAQHPELKKTPAAWGELVRAAYPGYTGPRPRVVIFHGTTDGIVSPDNQVELIEQWTDVHGADQTPDETTMVSGHERTRYTAGGAVVVESWKIAGMGHAVAMGNDPERACPPSGGTYIESRNLCAAYRAALFFGIVGGAPPPPPPGDGGVPPDGGSTPDGGVPPDGGPAGDTPTVAITAPGDGDVVRGTVAIAATAAAPAGIARVEFYVDGVLKGSDGSAPYGYRWATGNTPPGAHTIKAIAYDPYAVSAEASVEVMVEDDDGGGGTGDERIDPIPCGCQGGSPSARAGVIGLALVVLGALVRRRRRA